MYRTRLFAAAFVAVLVVGGTATAESAKWDKPPRNPDRDRWLREHREERREDADRERNARQAMQRWDREHNRRPIPVKRQEPDKALHKTNSRKRIPKKQRKRPAKASQHHATARKKSSKLVAKR